MNRLQPACARTVTGQIHGGLHIQHAEFSIGGRKHLIALIHGHAADVGQRRHRQEIERVERTTRQVHRRHRGGEQFAGFVQRRLELVGRELVGQRGKISGRLVEPQPAEQFAELIGSFQPRRLPRHFGDEIGFLPQTRRQFASEPLRPVGIWCAECDNQFAGVGEVLLVKFQALDGWLVRRQQVEDVHVKAQPRQAEADRHDEQRPPPAFQKVNHGERKPSKVSPVREFSSRQPPSGLRSKRNGSGSGFPASAVGR